jgi:hypothetical protein
MSSFGITLVRQGAERLHGVEEEIKTALRQAPVLHHDETGMRVVGAAGVGWSGCMSRAPRS